MTDNYESIGEVTKLTVSSRASVNIGKNYYTFEFTQEKSFPLSKYGMNFNEDKEKELMWQEANAEVDKQINEIVEYYKNQQQNPNY